MGRGTACRGGEAGTDTIAVDERPNREIEWALRRLYGRQRAYYDGAGQYATTFSALDAADITLDERAFEPRLQATQTVYEITAPGTNGTTVHIRQDGKVWTIGE